jgi:hypothetical protein
MGILAHCKAVNGILRATIGGVMEDADDARRSLIDIANAAKERGIDRVLIDPRQLEGEPLRLADQHEIGTQLVELGFEGMRIAWMPPPERIEQARFTTTVARNRGIEVRLFADRDAAERWLREEA